MEFDFIGSRQNKARSKGGEPPLPICPGSDPKEAKFLMYVPEPGRCTLDQREIDGILNSIDSFETRRKRSLYSKNVSLFVHNFGVFDCSSSQTDTIYSGLDEFAESNSSPTGTATDYQAHDGSLETGSCQTHSIGEVSASEALEAFGHWSYEGDAETFTDDIANIIPLPEILGSLNASEHSVLDDRPGDCPQQSKAGEAHYHWESSTGAIIHNPSPFYLSSLEHFLMYHYLQRVVHLFCVIDNTKSPWKTIHLPRAMQSVGQLSVEGSSSRLRNALRNALLSISAFYLANENKSRGCDGPAAKWANEATMFQGRAIQLLRDAVDSDFHHKSPPKYKEALATMLSMITINVMSGDTSTCGLHLDGASRFMSHARTWKCRYSPKARSLHRIYFYLRAIHESTVARKSDQVHRLTQDADTLSVRYSHLPSTYALDLAENVPISTADPTDRMSTYECIYGVPQSLLILLRKATELIRQVTKIRERAGSVKIPENYLARCDELERSIMDWPMMLAPETGPVDDMGASSDIISQTTRAFHNALIIYFAQHIRRLHYRYLQPYVQIVADSIEAIERIKSETRVLAAPLYWPAFIAASEAFEKQLQERYRAWYKQVEGYGIEAVRTGISVLAEVWKYGPPPADSITSRWQAVVDRTGASLMLS